MKKLMFLFICSICLSQVACISILQTSNKIRENDVTYYVSVPDDATTAFTDGNKIFVKSPKIICEKTFSWVQVLCPPSAIGGWRLEQISSNITGYEIYEILIDEPESEFPQISYEKCENFDETAQLFEIPLPSAVIKFRESHLPQYFLEEQKLGEKHGYWSALATLDAIVVDFPVSVLMTLTGSVWYIPFAKSHPYPPWKIVRINDEKNN